MRRYGQIGIILSIAGAAIAILTSGVGAFYWNKESVQDTSISVLSSSQTELSNQLANINGKLDILLRINGIKSIPTNPNKELTTIFSTSTTSE